MNRTCALGLTALASVVSACDPSLTSDDCTPFGKASHCGASSDTMAITWGGPIATYRWDSAEDVDFKWLSVRELE